MDEPTNHSTVRLASPKLTTPDDPFDNLDAMESNMQCVKKTETKTLIEKQM
jgi:hypothetical protein